MVCIKNGFWMMSFEIHPIHGWKLSPVTIHGWVSLLHGVTSCKILQLYGHIFAKPYFCTGYTFIDIFMLHKNPKKTDKLNGALILHASLNNLIIKFS